MPYIKQKHDGEKFKEDSYTKLGIRFLRYGLLAWGGPIAQLALIEREMVYKQKLLSVGYFNRLIAMYQAFPGPETHEICVHLGTQAQGPLGGLIAGLGFMMPGFILMMFFSWIYVLYGMTALATTVLLGIKPAVVAWIIKGGIQLGKGILVNPALWIIAIMAFFAELFTIHFLLIFSLAGILYLVCTTYATFIYKHRFAIVALCGSITLFFVYVMFGMHTAEAPQSSEGSALATFLFGLKCGSLSFGSVYTVLSMVKTQAIAKAHWLTQSQFIDGLALAGSLPAPFIIVTTFVGYMAYGFWGGILATVGTFLIPFLIPMFGSTLLNRVAANRTVRTFLDGVTAAVAGLIAADILDILGQVLVSAVTVGIFIASLCFLLFSTSTYAIVWLVLAGGFLSTIFSFF